MRTIQTFQVFPNIPEPLAFLETLVRNIWWCWQRDAVEVFRRINPGLWGKCGGNPILFLTRIDQERLEELARDKGYLSHLARVRDHFDHQVTAPQPYETPYDDHATIAYFSMEFGLHRSIPLYSGGLGILAGDHLKASADHNLPLVGIGLFYRQGYFQQFLDDDGRQQEAYPENDIFMLPMERARGATGQEIMVTVDGPQGRIHAAVWVIHVGSIPLYLLDTNVRENPPEFRDLTDRLYSGGSQRRLAQELVLGIGGMRALEALDRVPWVVHMNEGHSAFASLERLRHMVATQDIDLKTALEIVPRTTVFTTHTPVAAGHDDFAPETLEPCFKPLAEALGTDLETVIAWGQAKGKSSEAPLSMFVLGKRMAALCNGVSELHGAVARRMWHHLWPGITEDEVPITHVTNGVHIATWTSPENTLLFERYIGPDWHMANRQATGSRRLDEIYDEELWHAHETSRARLIRSCRRRMTEQYGRRNAAVKVMKDVAAVLDQDILTIAFARRFATYKRADLLLTDPARLEAMINHPERPVQFIFAGKAHPQDDEGKKLIQRLIAFANRESVRHRFIFLENYDMHIARRLLHGADAWLNTPRRPFEACGTSGMKAAVNGVLNLSVLDGWWCEGYREDRGWSIGRGEEFNDYEYQDRIEAQALYNVLENEVIPCFYERDNGGLPLRWLKMMKNSMKMVMQNFSAQRMVSDYNQLFYRQAAESHHRLLADRAAEAVRRSQISTRLRKLWPSVMIDYPVTQSDGPMRVGDLLEVNVMVNLGEIQPEEVDVELCYGHPRTVDTLDVTNHQKMTVIDTLSGGRYLYSCNLPCNTAGRYGFTARVTPRGDIWTRYTPGLIAWS